MIAESRGSSPPIDDVAEQGDVEPAVDDETVRFRYPGSAPFGDTDVDRLLFRGRAIEIDTVLHSILSFDLFLLYSASGMGKTSLLTAGVLQHLRDRNFWPVILRLNDPRRPTVDVIAEQITQAGVKADDVVVGRNPNLPDAGPDSATLWDFLSGLEVWRDNTLQQPVLIFDQFEELFTLDWDDAERAHFIASFGEVVRRHRVRPSGAADTGARLPLPSVKIVVAMREDSIGELERLAIDVPHIMQNRFRLEGLEPEQAEAAIREPALMRDDRLATAFTYSADAAKTILDFLRTRKERDKTVISSFVEPPQLQIICEHIERSILPDKRPAIDADPEAEVEISEADLGGPAGLDRILRDFYRNKLQLFGSAARKKVRALCETGLISQHRRRLSLEEGEIGIRFKVPPKDLDQLVEHRLIRAEPRVGSIYYELAHDTLVNPILAYRDAERIARRNKKLAVAAVAGIAMLVAALLYALSQGGDDGDDVQQIEVGRTVTGDIAGSGSTKVFEFAGTGDAALAVTVLAGGGLDPVVEVSDPNGALRLQDGLAGEAASVVVRGDLDGRYQVAVRNTGSSTGSFELSVAPVEIVPIGIGASDGEGDGNVVAGRISGPGDVRVFEYSATGGETLVVEALPASGVDVVLDVTDPNDVVERRDNDGAGRREVAVVSPAAAGNYRVVVSGYGSSAGPFALAVQPADVVEVSAGDAVAGEIARSDDVAVFDVATAPDEMLVVEALPASGLDVVLAVTNPNGVAERRDANGSGRPEVAVVGAPLAGNYQVVVGGYLSSAGPFELSVGAAEVVEVAAGDVVSARIAEADDVVVFVVATAGDDSIEVEVVPDDSLDVLMEVTNASGFGALVNQGLKGATEIADRDVGLQARSRIVVGGHQSSTGDFQLSVRPSNRGES